MNVTAFLIALMVFLAAVLLFPALLRHKSELAKLALIGEALEKGQTIEPALLDQLTARRPPVLGKWYAVLCFLMSFMSLGSGVGLLAASRYFVSSSSEAAGPGTLVGGMIVTAVGLAYLTLGVVSLWRFTGRVGPPLRLSYASALALICLFVGVAAFGAGAGLAGAAPFFAEIPNPEGDVSAGLRASAVLNIGPGLGFIALGVLVLRLFKEDGDG